MRRTSRSRKCGRTSTERSIRKGTRLEFLLSPTRDAEAAKRFLVKALRSTAGSTPQVHPVEEQMAEPTAATNPVTSVPRVINVDKNAAYPKAIAELKAAGHPS